MIEESSGIVTMTTVGSCEASEKCKVNEASCNSIGGTYVDFYQCPNGCSDGACLSSTKPTIKVISPNGGEVFETGKSYNIIWNSSNLLTSDVFVYLTDKYDNNIMSIGTVFNSGKNNWTVPSDIVAAGASGSFKIYIGSNDKGPSTADYSDGLFSIVNNTPVIDITSCVPPKNIKIKSNKITDVPVIEGRNYMFWIDPVYSPARDYCNGSSIFTVSSISKDILGSQDVSSSQMASVLEGARAILDQMKSYLQNL